MSGALRCINRAAAGKNVVATASAAVATAASQQGCTLSTISTTTATTTTTTTAASVRSFPSVAPAKPSPPNSGGGGCSGSVDDENATSNQEGDDSRGRGGRNPSPHHHQHQHQHHLGSGAGVNMHSNGGFREGAGGGAPGVGGGRGAGGVGGLSPSMSYGKRMVSSKSSLLGPAYSGGRTAGAGGAPPPTRVDAVVVGAGQAGLSVAYHLQKAGGLRFVTLDANQVRCCGSRWCWRCVPSPDLLSWYSYLVSADRTVVHELGFAPDLSDVLCRYFLDRNLGEVLEQ